SRAAPGYRGRRRRSFPANARLRLWVRARRRAGALAGAGRHRGAAAAVGGAGATGVVAHDLLIAQDLADLVVGERLVLEQRLGDAVQVLEMVGQDLLEIGRAHVCTP